MDLILFTTNFPLGHSEQFLESEIRYLSSHFDNITLVPLTDSGSPSPRPIPNNVGFLEPLLKFSLDRRKKLFLRAFFNCQPIGYFLDELIRHPVIFSKSKLRNWLSAAAIGRASMASETYKKICELVTSNTLFYFYWGDKSSILVPFLKQLFPSNRFIARFHGTDLYDTKSPGYIPFRKSLLSHLDLLVCISRDGQRYLIEKYPFAKGRTLVSRLGVVGHGRGQASDDGILRIVTCSNVVSIKRLDVLARAVNLLDFQVIWSHLGDGPLLNKLKEIANSFPANLRFLSYGALKNSEVIRFYQENAIDIFINVSAHEGLPVSIMEALSFGVPVIAPAIGGIPEIVEKEHGTLLPALPVPEIIADEIKKFYQLSREEKGRMRESARIFWQKHYDADKNYTDFCRQIKNPGDSTQNESR